MKQNITYLTGNELLKQLGALAATSEEILVAMAFASIGGVESFSNRLKQAIGSRPFALRVILDHNFSPTKVSREIILSKLKDLGATVKISNTPSMMHSKVYIFRSGTSLSAVCGSANLTRSGFDYNIELNNVSIDIPNEPKQQLTEWFERHWTCAKEVNESSFKEIIQPIFMPGLVVVIPAIAKCGIVVQPPPGETAKPDQCWLRCGTNELLQVGVQHLALSEDRSLNRTQSYLLAYRALNGITDLVSLVEASRIIVYPHQVAPVLSALSDMKHVRLLVADEVGLGKTITAALFIAGLSKQKDIRSVLIVVPSGLEDKWSFELASRFGLKCEALTGERLALLAEIGFDETSKQLHVISHELLRINSHLFERLHYQVLVVDEIHRGRNPTTRTHQGIEYLSKHATFVLGLSATPIQTSSSDLANAIKLIDPHPLQSQLAVDEKVLLCRASRRLLSNPSRDGFEELKHVIANLRTPQSLLEKLRTIGSHLGDRESLSESLSELCSMDGHIFRTTKKDLGYRIPRKLHNVFIALDEEHEEEYFSLRHQVLTISPLNALLWERLYCSNEHTARAKFKEMLSPIQDASISQIDQWDDTGSNTAACEAISRKEQKLLGIAESLRRQERKAIIFCGFVATSRRVAEILRDRGRYRVDQMDGTTPVQTRLQYLNNLRERGAHHSDFLVSTSVGQEGLDMQFMDTIINYDLPWNPMILEQRIGRIDRIGQKAKELHIYNMFVYASSRSKETVDKRLMRVLLRRLLEVKLHMGDTAPILQEAFGNQADDDIVRAAMAVQQVNEWLPGLEISRMDQVNRFVSEVEARMIPAGWIIGFVGQLASIYFPGTTVAAWEDDVLIRPSNAYIAAVRRQTIQGDWQAEVGLIEDVWFCTANRARANEHSELIFLTPQHPIVCSLAELHLQTLEKDERHPLQGTKYFVQKTDEHRLVFCDARGAAIAEPVSQYYAVLAACRNSQ